jgi:hypothetical protein
MTYPPMKFRTGQWYGPVESHSALNGMAVLSIDDDRPDEFLLNFLSRDPIDSFPSFTAWGSVSGTDTGLCLLPKEFLPFFKPISEDPPIKAEGFFRFISAALQSQSYRDCRPDLELQFTQTGEGTDHLPRTDFSCLRGVFFDQSTAIGLLRSSSRVCSDWPLEQPTTWNSFVEWSSSVGSHGEKSEWLFRGHPCASYPLVSTLHRKGRYNLLRYQDECFAPAIDTLRQDPQLKSLIFGAYQDGSHFADFNKTFYAMRVLRHHGYPSPLLDWTADPLIAGFFAIYAPVRPEDDFIIYACNLTALEKSLFNGRRIGSPQLLHPSNLLRLINREDLAVGPVPIREVRQKSRYMLCGIADVEGFVRQLEKLAAIDNDEESFNFLLRFRFSGCERHAAAASLDSAKISRYSLFRDPDSAVSELSRIHFS